MKDVWPYETQSRNYGYALLGLTVLFGFRVFAQLIQVWYPIPFLPPFHAWHSGTLPYWVLVLVQLLIFAGCIKIVVNLFNCTIKASVRKGNIYMYLGLIYFAIMCVRLVAGFTVAKEHVWFGAKLPTVFHLVLATFVMIYGHFHLTFGPRQIVANERGSG